MENNKAPEGTWDEGEKKLSISLADFNKLCTEIIEQNKAKKAAEDALKRETEVLEELKSKFVYYAEEAGMTTHTLTGVGTVYVSEYYNVSTPKTAEQKKLLFDYLREKGILWEMVNVNSATLNSFHNAEIEAAKLKGDIDFKLPGVGEPVLSKRVGVRKA